MSCRACRRRLVFPPDAAYLPLHKNAKIELLRRTPLFSNCSKRELAEIATIADEIDIPDGNAFVREGERGREFFAVHRRDC